MSVKSWLLTVFRELFLYHYKSLEFRAEVFALIIAPGCKNAKDCSFKILKEVAAEIYKNDRHRQDVFLNITRGYAAMILRNEPASYDEAIKDINRKVRANKSFAMKINMNHINRFLRDDISEDKRFLQQRIAEFLEDQSKEASCPINIVKSESL
ncbi:MAG: hypothetical protein LBF71_00975 [Campylobacteraceae bacterium]|jgi:ribosomal protein L18E|nr:hypothetical protein [Campylobacteraceae bacterium]